MALRPCQYLGPPTGDWIDQSAGEASTVRTRARACGRHGECHPTVSLRGRPCCPNCPDYAPDPSSWVAPLGGPAAKPWEGSALRRPWDYRVAVAIPTLLSAEVLEVCLALVRAQDEPAYVVLVDTGTPWRDLDRLEALRGDGCEVHHLRGGGRRYQHEAVCEAFDLAFAVCQSPVCITAHQDTLLCRRDAVRRLADQVTGQTPVVGWEQSPRSGERWRGCVGHVWTGWHMPTMRAHGVTWSWRRWVDAEGVIEGVMGWPDVEQPVNRCLALAGIKPTLIGQEHNGRQCTEWWDHPRTSSSAAIGAALGRPAAATVEEYTREALAEARARLRAWEAA